MCKKKIRKQYMQKGYAIKLCNKDMQHTYARLESINPKGLAPSRRIKKGGRAAVIPLGEVNPPPAPEGRSRACWTDSKIAEILKP